MGNDGFGSGTAKAAPAMKPVYAASPGTKFAVLEKGKD
jgi:hypothetical protein